jgi:phosphate transport system permease protein
MATRVPLSPAGDPLATGAEVDDAPDAPRPIRHQPTGADRVFRGAVRGAAVGVLVLMGLIGAFLLLRAGLALRTVGWSFFTQTQWLPDTGRFGIAAALPGTFLIAAVALVIAVPLSIGSALYISEFAPRRVRPALVSLVDLMAAIPSIVYGLWGFFFLQPRAIDVSAWLTTHAGWFPLFRTENPSYAASTFIAGIVVSLMVTPIITSIGREVFSQAPSGEREGALALGATHWAMIRTVVLPFGRGGLIGGTMLGMGRALGETIAVYLIISPLFGDLGRMTHILETGGLSISSLIALRYQESSGVGLSALMAAGLSLFTITLVVNVLAAIVVARSRSGAATEI